MQARSFSAATRSNLGRGITNDNAATQTINGSRFHLRRRSFSPPIVTSMSAPNGSLVINGRIADRSPSSYGRNFSVTKVGPGLVTLTDLNTFRVMLQL